MSASQLRTLRTLERLGDWVGTSNQHGATYVPTGSVLALEKKGYVEIRCERDLRYVARITRVGIYILSKLGTEA